MYAKFRSSLDPEVHATILDEMKRQGMGQHTPHEDVPTLILRDPVVQEHVFALLGRNAIPDKCRHVHEQPPYTPEGPLHEDNYDEGGWPDVPMATLYCFPQDTPLEMGPTAIVLPDGNKIAGDGPAGTCLLMREGVGIRHQALANTTNKHRYMYKLLFRAS